LVTFLAWRKSARGSAISPRRRGASSRISAIRIVNQSGRGCVFSTTKWSLWSSNPTDPTWWCGHRCGSSGPDARLRFDLEAAQGGTDLCWTLYVDEPLPDPALTGHVRQRVGELINANLRYSYGQ
jgi:hypothetical protein